MAAYTFLRRGAALSLLLATWVLPAQATQASAGCSGSSNGAADVQSGAGVLLVGVESEVVHADCGSSTETTVAPPRDSDLDAVCVRQAIALDQDPFAACDLPAEPGSPTPQVTSALVLSAFRRIDLPASELVVQPPGGETLVNLATNFYTEQGAFTRTVRLLGRRVDLRITPSRYTWVFGDGASISGSSPGAAYPDLLVTHEYASKGGVRPRVDTTYSATYRVDGGAWRDVNGTVTIPGRPVGLMVRTAGPVLVSYH